jgi:biotin synthase
VTGIGTKEAVELLACRGPELYELFARAGRLRHERRGDRVGLCAIVNAKSGSCPEDCAFCAQSAGARSTIELYPLLPAEVIVDAARKAERNGAACFGIVTSGRSLARDKDLDRVAAAVGMVARETPLRASASLGILGDDALLRLRDAGLARYHHNLETAESFWPQVCSTRPWSESVDTIRRAQAAGLSTCCGGIFGLGESLAQRVDLLAAVRDLGADSVPINFLNPIPGTRLEDAPPLPPLEALAVIAVARLMMPDREIRVCGGRERVLGEFQSWIFLAGADGMMVGGYLTTPGRAVDEDLRMIAAAGLEVARRPP